MEAKKARYITTTLPYVNDKPHMGHALEFVQGDTLARYFRLMGHEVFFNLGVDEHGQKISRKADEAGVDRQEYVDKYAAQFDELKQALNLSNDSFIRTSSDMHKAAAAEMWRRCDKAGDIYKKKYKGLYCVGCESFKVESDLVGDKCPEHQTEPEEIEEENYFFKLSNYQQYLEEYLSKENSIVPDFRRQEALKFVQGGLEDLSISREKKRMDWGINVPGDDEHVMYVWFDALTNYISTLGWPEKGNFEKFWVDGDTLQLAGKDQIRFQSIIWQAMLKSAGVVGTDTVFYHGFINSDGQKMSKSLGNVIDPYDLVERYGTDATRYIMLRHVHPTDDSDLTLEKMDEWYTANLVNGLGNLTARIMKMVENYEVSIVESDLPPEDWRENPYISNRIPPFLDNFIFSGFLDEVWNSEIGNLDKIIDVEKPFKKIKENESAAKNDLKKYALNLFNIALMVAPALPDASKTIIEAIKKNKKPENLFQRLES